MAGFCGLSARGVLGETILCSGLDSSFTDFLSILVTLPAVLGCVLCLVVSVGLLVEGETWRGGLSWVRGFG